ncbi:phospholipase D-like domain-containing protein [Saccharospirillum mangrovi]|uniref:phospholipase D-like domain-containing protein n=1 Tax=Saccharospirillum mangrovi TaxID=2161747 RepID=UPI000D38F8B4|nr:phospholipase D-like domain-containing protein [Saccharospirillum mangrovi]
MASFPRVLPYTASLLLLITLTLTACGSMPKGLSSTGPLRETDDVALLYDQTYRNTDGKEFIEQEVMDEMLAMIASAQTFLVIDMFLYNDFAGENGWRPLSEELTVALIDAKTAHPDMPVVLITDPFNTIYGGMDSPYFDRLEAAGVDVVTTNLAKLPASNRTWTTLWTVCCRFLGNSTRGGWLPNPVGPGKVTLRSYLHLLNFRANHRKTLVVNTGTEWRALVTSMNPHDASSRHDNNAVIFSGAAAQDLLQTERAAALMSGYDAAENWPAAPDAELDTDGEFTLQVLTEGAIETRLLTLIDNAETGDQLDLEMFYLSSRPVVKALIRAHERGVELRVMLDANRDAFGREKNGIPNRQVAWDLHEKGITVRWCATAGEQCHRKWIRLDRTDGTSEIVAGSANFTRRNLHDLNMETSVYLSVRSDHPEIEYMRAEFERSWSNPGDTLYSLDYTAFADHSRWRYGVYRFMEATGMSTF